MELASVNGSRDDLLLSLLKNPFARIHFSQLGEDCLIWHYFHQLYEGFYVDVGCHDPFRYSNTYLLHRFRNWRGLNIDADPRAIAKFQVERPTDINVVAGIGAGAEERLFVMFKDGAVNTFDPQIASTQQSKFAQAESIVVQVRPLRDVLAEYVPPGVAIDYMNIDCEGLDHDVLVSNDWRKFRPKVVTVELFGLSLDTPLSNRSVQFLKSEGYRLKSYYHATAFFIA
jgi:FkbM family methyltransferase